MVYYSLVKKVLIATNNPGKFSEITKYLRDLPLEFVSLKDAGITEDVEENGATYFENSKMKAEFFSQLSKLPTIADDGGLEIEVLGGAPGVRSRRWLGHEATDEELINHLKKIAKELPDNKTAYFKVVLTFALPDGKVFQEYGEIQGIIAAQPHFKLLHGYPYRSFFFLPEIGRYYHENELTEEEMKQYNHRYKALQKLKRIIKRELGIKKQEL